MTIAKSQNCRFRSLRTKSDNSALHGKQSLRESLRGRCRRRTRACLLYGQARDRSNNRLVQGGKVPKHRPLVVASVVLALAASEDAFAARHEPTLRAPSTELKAALTCPAGLAKAKREPSCSFMAPAKPAELWAGAVNMQATLSNAGFASCYVTLPGYALGDLQVSVEYVVAAIRTVYKRTGRPIAIYGSARGHCSHGGRSPSGPRCAPRLPTRSSSQGLSTALPMATRGRSSIRCVPPAVRRPSSSRDRAPLCSRRSTTSRMRRRATPDGQRSGR